MTYVDPLELLQRWDDDPRYARIRSEMHPSRTGAIALSSDCDDALVCMATLAAIITRRELLIAGDDDRNHRTRVEAVADCCGHDLFTTTVNTAFGPGTWHEFLSRRVTA